MMGGIFTVRLHTAKALLQKLWCRLNNCRVTLSPVEMREKRPLVVVLGCTGTGKSDLGIAIAKNFNGEVISADSMQIYKGLDIATNKVTLEEMDGIPHHMMSFVEPSTSTYNVHQFTNEAISLLENLWAAGKLPIVVGGTGYYIEGILFKDSFIPTNTKDNNNDFEDLTDDEVYELLKRVDMESAMQVHRNNRFRVVRALQIYFATGKRKSEYLEDQCQTLHSEDFSKRLRYSNLLLFFLDADKQVLEQRINERVAKMVERGLRQELEGFYEQYHHCLTIHGIAQSIAIKEFSNYLQLDPNQRYTEVGEKLFKDGCELLKLHTQQYSRRQRRWVKRHLLGGNSLVQSPNIVFLDINNFHEKVVPNVLNKIENFLCVVSDDVLLKQMNVENSKKAFAVNVKYRRQANQIFHCETCDIDVQGICNWQAHQKGKKHRRMLQMKKKPVKSDSSNESNVENVNVSSF